MKASLDWLRDHAPLDAPLDRLARVLVDTGTEVTSVRRVAGGAVVARVVSLETVAEARKPMLEAVLDAGREDPVTVVTAATNIRTGDLVVWAPPGVLPAGWDEPLGVREMFGRPSPGMLLAQDELGLGDDHEGILVLDHGVPGQPVHEVLRVDSILEVEVTTNRPDCLSHLGLARELAAALGEPLREPDTQVASGLLSAGAIDGRLRVRVLDAAGCPRFVARIVESVRVGPSPEWLCRRLRAIGLRPINNVVDVTNYVAADLGQPLHAFDLDRFRQETPGLRDGDETLVVVRRAQAGERLVGLDGGTHDLDGDLVVCAGDRPASIAGVVGGEPTAVNGDTRTVILEGATWDPVSIRATSRRLGLRTDASMRFDKGLSDTLPPGAVDRAAALIAELGGGHVLRGAVDEHAAPLPPIGPIRVSGAHVEALLGSHVDLSEAATGLARLGFAVAQDHDALTVAPPQFRRDVRIPVDVVEEIGRSLGYARIPATLPGRRVEVRGTAPLPPVEDAVRDVLGGAGFDEAITWSFVSPRLAARLAGLGLGRTPIPLRNPLNEGWSVMRTSLLPGLCSALALNVHRGVEAVSLFEVGRAFWEGERSGDAFGAVPDGRDAGLPPLPAEPLLLGLVSQADDAGADSAATALRRIQAVLAWLGHEFRGDVLDFRPCGVEGMRPGRSAEVVAAGVAVGQLGELMASTVDALELRGRVVAAEVLLEAVAPAARAPHFGTPPRMPAVTQDLTVVVATAARAADALAAARRAAGDLLESVTLLPEYRSERLGEDRKSWTFRLVMRAADRTLTGSEAQEVQAVVEAALHDAVGAQARR
ncbi:MAG TPA: phenylalanine--tRNA ligase subunit beta [Candidatus Dormibacteraeota bacterium]|nr:phenylalanine--tRNA ligase subunit beta [Candidatus Dormibacteraeota bacterium]